VILTQADQFPLRVATVRQAIAADNTDRVDGLDELVDGNDTYGLTVTVTSVEGTSVNFNIAVDDQPKQPQ
jgi:hypothetical protein